MGALIVLLVMVVQQARAHAAVVAEQRVHQEKQQRKAREAEAIEQEDLEWQREVLEGQHEQLAETLAGQRLELSHLEDHIRRLQDELQSLQSAAAELQRIRSEGNADTEQSRAQLERLRNEIASAGRRLSEAREEAANRRPAFAIIPYEGANGTKRRPIYVECTERGIILQPEGIVLNRGDLAGPLGPGNPLDAALRAIREHWARHSSFEQSGEPYPLLIVRPNGTLAYTYAREALKAWDDEFGYELIDAEMQLDFAKPDPVLAERLQQTIQDARQRQEILIAAMPNQFKGRAAEGFVATPTRGGFRPIAAGESDDGFGGVGGGNYPSGDGADDVSFRVDDRQEGDPAAQSGQPQTPNGQQRRSAPGATSGTGGALSAISQQRGANWALPKKAAGATGYQVPVRVVCQYDLLTILPRPNERSEPLQIAARDPLRSTIDEFVKALWKQIETWDAAPIGGYWQPVLEVYVYPGAEGRFIELRRLLDNSGIQVQRQAQ
jgi:hypothetical protein